MSQSPTPDLTPDIEYRTEDEQREYTDMLLRQHVCYLAERSLFYRRHLELAGFDRKSFAGVSELGTLPFTTKLDLERAHREFVCVGEAELADVCLTSGTTAKPVAIWQSHADLERLAYNEEISLRMTGISAGDLVMNAASIDRCFMAGMAYWLGLRRIGACVMRCGSSSPAALAELMHAHRPNTIIGVPSTVLAIATELERAGIEPAKLGVARVVGIGEPMRRQDLTLSALGANISGKFGARVFSTYASTEMATAFTDCEAGAGGHIHPDLIAIEIINDEGRHAAAGEPGEIVATPLRVTGMPLLRLQTGDIATVLTTPCACGRRSPRLGPLLGRKCQALKYRGTTVYPPAIFAVLQEIRLIENYYIEVFDDYELSDRIKVVVGTPSPDALPADVVAERLAIRLRVKPEVSVILSHLVAAKTCVDGKRKPVVFFDHRHGGRAAEGGERCSDAGGVVRR